MVVYTTDDDGFRAVAERIATERGEPLVTEFEATLRTEGAVVWVDAPAGFTEQQLFRLQQRMLEDGPERGAFSLVTGYTPDLAEGLYFDRVEDDGEDLLTFTRFPPSGVPDDPGTTVLTQGDATASAMADHTEDRLRSFQISAGGRRIHLYLSEGLICGVPETQDLDAYPEPHPYCITDGERDCPLSDDLLPAERIDASHVFILSCSPSIDNGVLPAHVVMGLLDGAESLVGSYRVSANLPHELLLHHSLLADGYGANERCYLLSRNSHANQIMSHPYVSFGRPHAAVADPDDPRFEVDVTDDGRDLRVEVSDVDAHVVDFRVPEARLPETDDRLSATEDRLWVRNLTDTDATVYYSVFEEDGDARVLVYTGDRMRTDHLELELSAHRARHLERRFAIDSAKNVSKTDELGFLTETASEHASKLKEQIRDFPEETSDERFDADAHAAVGPRIDSIHGHVAGVRDELCSFVQQEANYLYRVYGDHVVDEDVYPADRLCTICGERPTFVRQVATWSGDTKRLFDSCAECGHVFEVPASGRNPDPTYPLVSMDPQLDGPDRQPVEITFENPTDEPVRATFQPVVLHMDNEGNDYFDPERRTADLLPGESHTAEFTIDASLLPEDTYHVMGLVVANLQIHAGYTTFSLGDAVSYRPPHMR